MNPWLSVLSLCTLPFALAQADTLTLGSTNAAAGTVLQLPFNFTNTNQIVGMQFDLKFPASVVDVGTAVAASATTNHAAESREVTSGTRRIIVYSGSNQLLPSDLLLNVPVTLKTGSPAGGPTLNVSNVILTNKQGQAFTPSISRPALDAWRLANFSEAERNDPNIIGDNKDPDGDGLNNLLEFLMGGNPKQKQATHELHSAHGLNPGDGHHYFTLTFRAGKNISAAGTLSVEGTSDLINWNSAGIVLTPTGVEDATTLEYEAAIQVDGSTRQFLRLAGSRNPGN